jgi:hypothetical protein
MLQGTVINTGEVGHMHLVDAGSSAGPQQRVLDTIPQEFDALLVVVVPSVAGSLPFDIQIQRARRPITKARIDCAEISIVRWRQQKVFPKILLGFERREKVSSTRCASAHEHRVFELPAMGTRHRLRLTMSAGRMVPAVLVDRQNRGHKST